MPGSPMNFKAPQEDDEEDRPKSAKNKLTGKYDMSVLREIARVEEAAIEELVELYGVDEEDELAVEFDIHELMAMDPGDRRAALKDKLADCPKPTDEFVDKYLERIKTLNPKLK
ncbi:protein phosphatase 1 regulatory subunit 14B [Tribonema minus]|uniref:Protein phosphatase 1 regulatory subunit 14B n=1 Tax=Tribonema minus TaxID=303371 RepID=A0A836CG67_9STRA|nr:protein phosphatase 1 regulatory subunit 14B [Tribonema minus]|eukprot:TRINITY_DN8110_c1_g1_i1.p2 TRINITY_DN8110_c1_g1~~TRINITY_DN8110_c1_g1_i1.p2  ORF type:complete len:114 (-),score=40.57 TRINITY_DN8110_c1_g1_i1:319-660(-)